MDRKVKTPYYKVDRQSAVPKIVFFENSISQLL